jgi:tRNA1(Val) A37 N6-methylase TrmN6
MLSDTALISVTENALLDGKLVLRQPKDGFRVAIDTILMAAAVPAKSGAPVFEPGAGCGAAALCLARRVAGVRVTGIEAQPDMVTLAGINIRANGLGASVTILQGDVLAALPPGIGMNFEHVMINPPYLDGTAARIPPDPGKAAAKVESGTVLEDWIDMSRRVLVHKGTLTIVHRAERLDAILAKLSREFGEVTLFPLWPRAGEAARRIVIRARKGMKTPLRLTAGMVLHQADGRFTPQADAVLRGGALIF